MSRGGTSILYRNIYTRQSTSTCFIKYVQIKTKHYHTTDWLHYVEWLTIIELGPGGAAFEERVFEWFSRQLKSFAWKRFGYKMMSDEYCLLRQDCCRNDLQDATDLLVQSFIIENSAKSFTDLSDFHTLSRVWKGSMLIYFLGSVVNDCIDYYYVFS